MKLTVKDLFNISTFSQFKLIAGAGGLHKPVEAAEILDFEFVQGIDISRDHVFDGNSIALTSLLFAKDNPNLIIDAVKKLHELNVSCMAYKTVIIKELPKEVVDFANANDFPLLEFGGDEYFEDIIFSIKQALDEAADISAIESDFVRVIKQDMSLKEEAVLCKKVNIRLKKFIRAVCIKDSLHSSEEQVTAFVKRMQNFEKFSKKAAFCKYYNSYFIILSQDEADKNRFDALFEDITLAFQIDKSKVYCGISSIRQIDEGFGKVIREAFWAKNIATIENAPVRLYEEIGIYRLVAPEINSPWVIQYMKEYLAPLLSGNEELLHTAKVYTLCRGDLDKTAKALYCHKNTVRYRLSKMHQLLDKKSNEKEFNENLSIAIKIYMLNEFL